MVTSRHVGSCVQSSTSFARFHGKFTWATMKAVVKSVGSVTLAQLPEMLDSFKRVCQSSGTVGQLKSCLSSNEMRNVVTDAKWEILKGFVEEQNRLEGEAFKKQMDLNARRFSARRFEFPEALCKTLHLHNVPVLRWYNKYKDPFGGYIDKRSTIAKDMNGRIVKGVDASRRPFVAFYDDESILCVLFQRYQPGSDDRCAGKNPLWVGVPDKSKVFDKGWSFFPCSLFDKLCQERLCVFATSVVEDKKAFKRARDE